MAAGSSKWSESQSQALESSSKMRFEGRYALERKTSSKKPRERWTPSAVIYRGGESWMENIRWRMRWAHKPTRHQGVRLGNPISSFRIQYNVKMICDVTRYLYNCSLEDFSKEGTEDYQAECDVKGGGALAVVDLAPIDIQDIKHSNNETLYIKRGVRVGLTSENASIERRGMGSWPVGTHHVGDDFIEV